MTRCFVCNWRKFLIHICIFRFCQDVLSKNVIFRNLWSCLHVKTWRNVLFVRNWRMTRYWTFIMFEFWRNVLFVCNWCMIRVLIRMYLFLFSCLDFDKMFCNDIIFCNFRSCLHAKIVFDVRWIISILIRSTFVLKCVSHRNVWSNAFHIKMFDQMHFTSTIRSKFDV